MPMLKLKFDGLRSAYSQSPGYANGHRTLTLLISAIALLTPSSAQAVLKDSPKALVDQAWQIVYRDFVDRSFNRKDWLKLRQTYLNRSYSSTQEAYGAVQAMLSELEDPFTRFLTPEGIKDLVDNVSGGFIGVGLTVGLDPQTKEWIVIEALSGSPAAAAQIQVRDVVVSINGQPTPQIDSNQISQYIIGPVGSKVSLQIRRGDQVQDYQLVREQLDLNPITYQAQATASGRVGYIRFPIFTTKSPQLMQRAIQALEQQHVKGYILDLRGNPGGVFEASIDIARMWLGQRQLISRVEQRGQQERYTAKGQALTLKPLIILVDGQSASASEVLSAALQENNRAKLIGSQTFGKGVVQTLANLQDGSGVVVTIAQYYTPKGNNIHKVGITPDVVVNVPAAEQIQRDPSLILPSQSDRSYARALKELSQVIRSQP